MDFLENDKDIYDHKESRVNKLITSLTGYLSKYKI